MTAKASASAFNSFFYQQQQEHQKHQQNPNVISNNNTTSGKMDANGVGGGGGVSFSNSEPVHDLHLKMSKKIAQLTKVIYALNSKNDESENLIANLKAQYDEERDQLIVDTNKKLEEFKAKLNNNSDQNKKIVTLEGHLKEFQKQREKALSDLEEFKLRALENEENLTLKHHDEIISLNRMLEHVKNDQESQHKHFEAAIAKFEADKKYQIEDLKSKHRLEMESLRENLNSNKDALSDEKKRLEDKYQLELNKLKAEIDSLNINTNKERSEYEQNMTKLKLFHTKELEALKHNSNNEYLNVINNMKVELEQLGKEKKKSENELRQKYEKKLEEIVIKDEEISMLKEKLNELQTNLDQSNKIYFELNEKVNEINSLNQKLESKFSELEIENAANLNKCEFQSKCLVEKSSQISKLEASEMQNTSIISDLKHELSKTKERLAMLESDRRNLENESLTLNDRNVNMIRSLEKQVEALNKENNLQQAEFNRKLNSLEEINANQMVKIKTEHKIDREELISAYESRLSMEMATYEEKIHKMERDLTRDFNGENQKLTNERNELKSKLDYLLDELKTKTKKYDAELSSLKELLATTQKDLTQTKTLNTNLDELKVKLEKDFNQLKLTSDKQFKEIEDLTKQLEHAKFMHETTSKDSQLELKVRLEKLTKELNGKWADTLKFECDSLRKILQKQKEDEKKFDLDKLRDLKDEEIANLKEIWQAKINELLDEISVLKIDLNEKDVKLGEEFEAKRTRLEQENRTLNEKLERLTVEYSEKLSHLQSQQNQELKALLDGVAKENENKIAELKTRHLEDLKSQTIAQKAAISSLKQTLEKSKELELEVQEEAYKKKLEMLKFEMEQNYYNEMDKLKNENEMEMRTIRAEMDRTLEIGRQKEREFEIKTDEFQTEFKLKQKHMDRLTNEINELKNINENMKVDIDEKTKEIKKIKSDVQNELKTREKLMYQKKEEEINKLNMEHRSQKQQLINEFKEAQEILKEKIVETEEQLRIMHERFLNRESREEDVELIESLKQALNDRENFVKTLNNEKKYFQMELVNRENNFNKMFNNNGPNIGIINPLNSNTKIKSKAGNVSSTSSASKTSQFIQSNSLQSVSGKLDPIPGVESPLHDFKLNPNKPLPKKFLS